MDAIKQQKVRRRLNGYASNDNRAKQDYLKIAALTTLYIAILGAFILCFKTLQPVHSDILKAKYILLSDIPKGSYQYILWDKKPILIYHQITKDALKTPESLPRKKPNPTTAKSAEANEINSGWIILYAQHQNFECSLGLKDNYFSNCKPSLYNRIDSISHVDHKNTPAVPWRFSSDHRYIIIGEDNINE